MRRLYVNCRLCADYMLIIGCAPIVHYACNNTLYIAQRLAAGGGVDRVGDLFTTYYYYIILYNILLSRNVGRQAAGWSASGTLTSYPLLLHHIITIL